MNSLDDLIYRVAAAFQSLSFREREMLKLRLGLGEGYTYTTAEIGRIFRKDARLARDVVRRALRKLSARDPAVTKDALVAFYADGHTEFRVLAAKTRRMATCRRRVRRTRRGPAPRGGS